MILRWIGTWILLFNGCGKSVWVGPPLAPEETEGLRTAELVAFSPDDDLMPVLSPDGRYLLYAGEQNGNLDVWVRDFGTNSTYPLTVASPTDDWDPEVSPDGRTIAFVSRRADAKGDLFLASGFESQEEPVRLTDEASADRQPRFSPDGRKIYFTSSSGVGFERVTELDLDTNERRRVSPTPGFDPSVSLDGRFIIYTAPGGEGRRPSPHLVLLRLADSATRTITRSNAPEGFARFAEAAGSKVGVVYVRFPDDDNEDGVLDARDRSSLWRIDVDLDLLFEGTLPGDPFPLTDGSENELFPLAANGFLYFTQGTAQQDIARLPIGGIFPSHAEVERYFDLARTFEEPRKRWFAFRCAIAKSAPRSLERARAFLRIGNLQVEEGRLDLAKEAYGEIVSMPEEGEGGVELRGLAMVELVAIDRIDEMQKASTPVRREGVLADVDGRLEEIADEFPGSRRIAARVDLEMAEVLVDRGDRTMAIAAFDRIVDTYREESFSSARAMLRRVELLGVAHDPDALGEAYGKIVEAHPDQLDVVREAAKKIVSLRMSELTSAPRNRTDELRRWIPRYGRSAVAVEARRTLASLLRRSGALDDAALELSELVVEARAVSDRLAEARAQRDLAEVEEARGRLDAASDAWRSLRSSFSDLPGVASSSREAITRVNLTRAREEERTGDLESARSSYEAVIENDVSQVEAHRRYMALSARTGHMGEAFERALAHVESSPGTPVANYVYGLALTWVDPPRLEAAKEVIDRAIELDPLLVHAYITRGWIAEMMQREEKSVWDAFATFMTKAVNSVIGQILDIAISSAGLLGEAIESYETALQLNQESLYPETEAEILINLGNAHYSLGDVTKDIGNFKIAFDLYLDAFRLDYPFRDRAPEIVFYERFGRAAAWAEEWAMAAMATRRAIRVAEENGIDARLTQLYGNLALIYQQAGEEAYARSALATFEDRLEAKAEIERLVVARREQARARLGTTEEWGARSFDMILDDLSNARRDLEVVGAFDRDIPDLLVPVTNNLSSGVYGFSSGAELDLNLALAEQVFALRGDRSRRRAMRRARLAVTAGAIDDIPSGPLGRGRQWPVTLLAVRERIGLMTAEARALYSEGDTDGGGRAVEAAIIEIDRFSDDDDLAGDRALLRLDRARLLALAAERDRRYVGEIGQALLEVEGVLVETGTAAPELAIALTSSAAAVRTSSIAGTPPRVSPLVREAKAVRARLLLAEAGAMLDEVDDGGGTDIGSLLGRLDSDRDRLLSARARLAEAVMSGAAAGPGLGARVVAAALSRIAKIDHDLGSPADLTGAFFASARTTAEDNGDLGFSIAIGIESLLLAGDPAAAEKLLFTIPPQLMEGHDDLIAAIFSETASKALVKGDVEGAIGALDRSLVYRRASGPFIEYSNLRDPTETAVSLDLGRRLFDLVSARRELASTPGGSDSSVSFAKRRVRESTSALREAAGLAASVSGEMAMRMFGRALDASLLQYDLRPDEAVVFAGPIDGIVHLFLVDGSTTTEEKYAVAPTRLSVDEARNVLAGTTAEPIRALLFAPFEARITGKRTLFVAAGDLGGPVPQEASIGGLDGPAIAHLSAPTMLELVRRDQLVGVDGTVSLAASGRAPLIEGPRRLEGSQVAAFRVGPIKTKLDPGQARRLDDRTPVEALEGRAVDTLIVEAEVRLEPSALERSVIFTEVSEESDDPRGRREADAYRTELPIGALSIPARIAILTSVSGGSSPLSDAIGLDLALIPRGIGTTILMPAAMPDDARRALVSRLREETVEHAAAEALRRSVKALATRHPSVRGAALIGSPGLGREARRSFAKDELKAASSLAQSRFKARRFAEAAQALERWIKLQRESGEDAQMKVANDALVGILVEHIRPPRIEQAVDHQLELVRYLERQGDGDTPKDAKKLEQLRLEARLILGRLYSDAQDFEKAETTFFEIVRELEAKGDADGLAQALYELAMHEKRTLDDEAAVALMERSIDVYEKAGAYERKVRPPVAEAAVLRVAETYLNRLSDPERAKRAFARALSLARTDEGRVNIEIGLARSARRSGDFEEAETYAMAARTRASDRGLLQLALSASIEAANVAWYRGDYRKAADLCTASLAEASAILHRLKTDTAQRNDQSLATQKRSATRLSIYTRSVCGLTAMSQGDFEGATDHLRRALAIAESIDDEREVSAQYNNLGRVFLEFGKMPQAIEAFRSAERIDRRLDDRYALAYDLRNLGGALARVGKAGEAKVALETALGFSEEVKDKNNELRARFALAELLFDGGDLAGARKQYGEALGLAERLDVKELAWQIHRALGAMHERSAEPVLAEEAYRKAIDIAARITGRASGTESGAHRYAAFDDLISLLLDQDRVDEAFDVTERARVLELGEMADVRPGAEVLAELFEPARLAELKDVVPEDGAILVYRALDDELVMFAIDRSGTRSLRSKIERRALYELIEENGRQLSVRADVTASSRALSEILIRPAIERLAGKKRIAIVPFGPIRYVPFAALTAGDALVVDRYSLVFTLAPKVAAEALSDPLPRIGGLAIVALGAAPPAPGAADRPLPFADKELDLIREEYPHARIVRGEAVTVSSFAAALRGAEGVLHFAGHGLLAGERGERFVDPLGGRLLVSDGSVTMKEIIGVPTKADLVVLSACQTLISSGARESNERSGDDLRSLAQAFRLAGARWIIATTMHVHDMAASLVVKHLYRTTRDRDIVEGLRLAQLEVRKLYPHPAWWATFAVMR